MGTQSKKIDKTKAKDRKKGFQPIFQAICFDLGFCCFLILSLFSSHLVGSFFFNFKRIAFRANFYERNAFQCNRIRYGS